MKSSLLLLALVLASSCSMIKKKSETKVSETPKEVSVESIYALEEPIIITEDTSILDVRPLFEYTTGHLPGSVTIQVKDYQQKDGMPIKPEDAVRRLALLGVAPGSPVVIVGSTAQAGWMSWFLTYLGLDEVQSVPLRYFDDKLTTEPTRGIENKNYWKPKVRKSLLVDRAEVVKTIAHPEDASAQIIDVRSSGEFLSQKNNPNINAINIEFDEFFNDEGRPEISLIERLKSVGITADKRILVVSSKGLRSAAVAKALYDMGYTNTGHFPGGINQLLKN